MHLLMWKRPPSTISIAFSSICIEMLLLLLQPRGGCRDRPGQPSAHILSIPKSVIYNRKISATIQGPDVASTSFVSRPNFNASPSLRVFVDPDRLVYNSINRLPVSVTKPTNGVHRPTAIVPKQLLCVPDEELTSICTEVTMTPASLNSYVL